MTTEITSEPRRLILVGGGPQEIWEPAFASVADSYDLVLVSPAYPAWQAKYVRKHRIANIRQQPTLFAAIADLRGEVADAAVLTWEVDSVAPVAEIAKKLRMRFMAPEAVFACLDARTTAARQEPGGFDISAYSIVRDGQADVARVIRTRQAGNSAGTETVSVITDWQDEPWAAAAETRVREAHRSVGADWGVTETRLNIRRDGVSLAGLRTWFDPDLVSLLGGTTAETDLFKASAAMLFEPVPVSR